MISFRPKRVRMYKVLARRIHAIKNNENLFIREKAENDIEYLMEVYFPAGSGFNSGTVFEFDKSTENRLVISTEFHHMNEAGYYTRVTKHEIIVTPSLMFDFDFKITGQNYNNIKEYMEDVFYDILDKDMTDYIKPKL